MTFWCVVYIYIYIYVKEKKYLKIGDGVETIKELKNMSVKEMPTELLASDLDTGYKYLLEE